ncbi:lipopolysaccharide biosynthesis protein [Sediminibacterium sp.]|uniref:lipopolysaccharide biosynthesis protein n=1 Tax=Sediminibacterium sp. TaxID=1917865 RepID=UPI00273152F5|nr:oligosaccharide flippase family protein [Sediminibacterium sp.]MDP2420245.1 oligosaccharide flippase family protein [Sediminibacterium sp.]
MTSSFVGFLKHGGNYLFASFANSALVFISIPIYTRLLNTEEYGIVSIFLGITNILASLMSFSTDRSVSRYFFDQKDELDFKKFVGASSILAFIFFIINSILLAIFAEEFGEFIGLNKYVVYLLIPVTAINILGLTFEQIYGPIKRSRDIARSSITKVILGFIFSILLIILFKKDKYYGQILGQIIAGVFMLFVWIKLVKPYFIFSLELDHIKYIFKYSVPLIPYALSGVIIEQFGKIFIGGSLSLSQAGFYNLALMISSIVNIIIGVTHQAWNPYFFEYMNTKNYQQLDKDYIRIFKITIFVAFGVASFGKEIGLVMAKNNFTEALFLIPFFTIGYIFSQFAFVYLRNFGYAKKILYMSITIFASGILNIFSNILLMKSFGQLGVAIAFVISYIFMTILGWFFNAFIVKIHATPLKKILPLLLLAVPFYCTLFFLLEIKLLYLSVVLKFILITLFSLILVWNDRNLVLSAIKKFKFLNI